MDLCRKDYSNMKIATPSWGGFLGLNGGNIDETNSSLILYHPIQTCWMILVPMLLVISDAATAGTFSPPHLICVEMTPENILLCKYGIKCSCRYSLCVFLGDSTTLTWIWILSLFWAGPLELFSFHPDRTLLSGSHNLSCDFICHFCFYICQTWQSWLPWGRWVKYYTHK